MPTLGGTGDSSGNRALLGAVVGPRASTLLVRHFADGLERVADRYAQHVSAESRAGAAELRSALAQMREADRQRALAGSVDGSTEVPSAGVPALSETPPGIAGLTVVEVATMLDCSREWVRSLCRAGQLVATSQGRTWLISRWSVGEYLDARRNL